MTGSRIDKELLRKESLARRDSLEWEDIIERSRIISSTLLSIPALKDSKTVMLYASKGSEVFTHELIRELLPGKSVVLPKVEDSKKKVMVSIRISSFDELSPGFMGILEPLNSGKATDKKDIELVIVPVVAFDRNLNRLGYGLGFYDRFLRGCSAVKIGLAFEFQKTGRIPASKLDVPLDMVVTEKRVYS